MLFRLFVTIKIVVVKRRQLLQLWATFGQVKCDAKLQQLYSRPIMLMRHAAETDWPIFSIPGHFLTSL